MDSPARYTGNLQNRQMARETSFCTQVEKVIAHVMKTHGRLDGVANCAGNVVSKSAVATHLDDLEQVR